MKIGTWLVAIVLWLELVGPTLVTIGPWLTGSEPAPLIGTDLGSIVTGIVPTDESTDEQTEPSTTIPLKPDGV